MTPIDVVVIVVIFAVLAAVYLFDQYIKKRKQGGRGG